MIDHVIGFCTPLVGHNFSQYLLLDRFILPDLNKCGFWSMYCCKLLFVGPSIDFVKQSAVFSILFL